MTVCVPGASTDPQNMKKGHPLSYSKCVCIHTVYIWLHILHHIVGSLELEPALMYIRIVTMVPSKMACF